MGFRVQGLGFRVKGLGFRAWGSGFGDEGCGDEGIMLWSLCLVQGLEFQAGEEG